MASCALIDSQLVPHIYIESETEHKYSLKYFVWKNETASKFKMGAVVEILLKFQIDTF